LASLPPPVGTGPRVTGLSLVDAERDLVIGPLEDGAIIDMSSLATDRLNVRAGTDPATVGSVAFELDDEATRVENAAPYALAGDDGGDYRGWSPAPGSHRLAVTAYSQSSAGGVAGTPLIVEFTVATEAPPPPPAPAEPTVTEFLLVDAATDEPLTQLRDGAIVDLSELGTRAENDAPFALAGNIGTDYRSWTPSLGSHVLTAEPYAERDAEGAAGAALSVAFDVRE
jgi:hypothetical protein